VATEPVVPGPTPAPAQDVTLDAGDGDGKGIYFVLKHVLLGPPIKRIFRPKVVGLEHVPRQGPAIIASNHLSYADWLFMPLAVPRRVTFVAKSDYFVGRGLKGMFQRGFFKGTGQVPIDRSGGSASEGALRAGKRVLERGELFGIYPEGTRSYDGRLYKGRTGVARLALETKVPVIPCGVVGTDKVAPPGKVVASLASPTVTFGEPLDFSRYDGMEKDRLILRAVTDAIMYRLMELSGQEYVDMYATKAKELAGRATTGAPRKIRKAPEPTDDE
jgi:1-acyl-sn-glycerol-3-phosphate acyltransferase